MENIISFTKSVASCFATPFIKLWSFISYYPEIFHSIIGTTIGGWIVWGVQRKYSKKRIKEKGIYSARYIEYLSMSNIFKLSGIMIEIEAFKFKMTYLDAFIGGVKSKSALISHCRNYFENNAQALKKEAENNYLLTNLKTSHIRNPFSPLMRKNFTSITPNADVVSGLLNLESKQTRKIIDYIIYSLNQIVNQVASMNQLINQIDYMINSILLEESKNNNYKLNKKYSRIMYDISKHLLEDIISIFINFHVVYKELSKLFELNGFDQSGIIKIAPSSLEKDWDLIEKQYSDKPDFCNYERYLKS